MHGDAVSSTFAIGCCSLQAACQLFRPVSTVTSPSEHVPVRPLCAADQVYTLHYLSMSDAGALTLLTAALEQGALVARHAFTVLRHLFAKHTLPPEQIAANEALLARMQGLRRCSALLCPIFSKRGDTSAPCFSLPHPPPSTCLYCQRCALQLCQQLSTAKLAAVLWMSILAAPGPHHSATGMIRSRAP